MDDINQILEKMKNASVLIANADTGLKNKALSNIKEVLLKNKEEIFSANKTDLLNAEKNKLALPLIARLKFDEKKLNAVISGIEGLIKLDDPVNNLLEKTLLDDGLLLKKVSVPIGVIGIIFESRPDALVQISTLCIKSGNCAILKGGYEALNTNRVLSGLIINAIEKTDELFKDVIYLLETREEVSSILKYDKYINLIIPRGSNEFVRYIKENSKIPVLGHADGICHLYVDKEADIKKAVDIAFDAKTQYVAVCNALETLLVHKDIAKEFLPLLKKETDKKNVILKGCSQSKKILPEIEGALEEDWSAEYLDYILAVKIVENIDEAIDHINKYGSKHTDGIVSEDKASIEKFEKYVDSSSVMSNCSTRFSDGFIYGMGAEVGISTNKIHARGPVGLGGLTIYKFLLEGSGQTVDEYISGNKKFKHKKLL